MVERRSWPERWARPGWHVSYTPLGGHLRRGDPVPGDGSPLSRKLNRMRSQAFLAVTEAAGEPDDDIAYFATVARKIIQRGSLPPTPTAVESLLLRRAESTRPAQTSPEP